MCQGYYKLYDGCAHYDTEILIPCQAGVTNACPANAFVPIQDPKRYSIPCSVCLEQDTDLMYAFTQSEVIPQPQPEPQAVQEEQLVRLAQDVMDIVEPNERLRLAEVEKAERAHQEETERLRLFQENEPQRLERERVHLNHVAYLEGLAAERAQEKEAKRERHRQAEASREEFRRRRMESLRPRKSTPKY
ncbi:MAG: hypothetical protein M1819_002018 [Sarea resinae]|nr:MAG: hypothetical protein M1819_002018 [Sarea resinae]